MQLCDRCSTQMKSGTHYESDKHNRYVECSKCYARIDRKKEINFSQVLHEEILKQQKFVK